MADGKSDSDSEDVIVRDSIIKNKERTKSYWEQLMMAAASENQNMVKVRNWDINETSNSNPPSNRNSVSSTEYAEEPLNNNHKGINENGDAVAEMELELRNVKDEKRRIEREIRLRKERYGSDSVYGGLTMEDRIAMELQEMKAREEELKQLRNKLFLENGKDISPPKETTITNGVEELSSLHTTDDSNYSEYGSEEKEHSLDGNSRVNTPHSEDFMHRRTQSLDSVSSGHSSGSGSTLNDRERESSRRRILVRPYEDPEEEQTIIIKRNEKETPIEREIRLAKEREEELKREKGMIINNSNNSEPEVFKIKNKLGNKKDALQNDTRGVQHRLATNRIQQEIEEANERENELRTEGKILTTSEETVDAKVTRFTQLAESAILENRHTKEQKVMKRSSSMSQLLISMNNEEKPKETTTTAPIKTYVPQVTRRFAPNSAQKGIMQRFIATKGQLSLSPMNTAPKYSTMSHISRPPPKRLSVPPTETVAPTRKGYTPVEEKIQEELKEMKKREEELRLQRAYSQSSKALARSQPNLLEITQDEEELTSWTSHKENTTKTAPRLSHSVSNPNLLDDSLDKVNRRTSRKRFSLLQEWENRIQSIQQEV